MQNEIVTALLNNKKGNAIQYRAMARMKREDLVNVEEVETKEFKAKAQIEIDGLEEKANYEDRFAAEITKMVEESAI
jgi:uncharacterized lipoprotein YehR (DUF1307 family)